MHDKVYGTGAMLSSYDSCRICGRPIGNDPFVRDMLFAELRIEFVAHLSCAGRLDQDPERAIAFNTMRHDRIATAIHFGAKQ